MNVSFKNLSGLFLVAWLLIGCHKKTAPVEIPASAVSDVATPAAPVPAAPKTFTRIEPATDVGQSLSVADAALKARNYDQAVQNLLAVQAQKQLTDQQAAQAHRQMIGLQNSLAAGIANGDPNAKAAADRLRQSAMVR